MRPKIMLKRTLVLVVLALAVPACSKASASTIQDLVADPAAFDGQEVRVTTGYLSSFEVSVLTSGFAESYPPQAMEPTVWVDVGLSGPCVEEAKGVSWSEDAIASGVFSYEPDGGFGHLGAYKMILENATLSCA